MDKIIISDFPVETIIGTYPEERTKRQQIWFDLILSGDFSKAGKSDTLENTVNYRAVEERLIQLAEQSHYFLLEALAEHTAQMCLEFPEVADVTVRITKPDAALRGEKISLEIFRTR